MDYGKDNIQNVYVCIIFNDDKYSLNHYYLV